MTIISSVINRQSQIATLDFRTNQTLVVISYVRRAGISWWSSGCYGYPATQKSKIMVTCSLPVIRVQPDGRRHLE